MTQITDDVPATIPHRVTRLQAWMEAAQLDCLIAAGPLAVNHLFGYRRYFGGLAAAVIAADGSSTLLVPHDEGGSARGQGAADSVHTYGERGFGLVPDQARQLAAALALLGVVASASRIGLSSEASGVGELLREQLRAAFTSAAGELERIRLVKDPDELERIGRAYELAWTAQDAVRCGAHPGASEIELFTAGLAAAQLSAGQPIEFAGDLLGGARSAEVCAPIRVASRTTLAQGDAVISDLVVGCEGYWGDTAATFAVGGAAEVESVREELQGILDQSARLLTPGRPAAEVFEAMRALIAQSFPNGEFPHHGGHGVGLGSYDAPHVIPSDDTPLEAGMVIALEPGVYFSGHFGARVEEMYVVAADGGHELRSLSHHDEPKGA